MADDKEKATAPGYDGPAWASGGEVIPAAKLPKTDPLAGGVTEEQQAAQRVEALKEERRGLAIRADMYEDDDSAEGRNARRRLSEVDGQIDVWEAKTKAGAKRKAAADADSDDTTGGAARTAPPQGRTATPTKATTAPVKE